MSRNRNVFFYFYIVLITFLKGISLSAGDPLYLIAFVIGCGSLFLKVFEENYCISEFISMISILAIGILDLVIGHGTTILFSAICFCGLKGVDELLTLKLILWTKICAFTILIGGAMTGLVHDKTYLMYRDSGYVLRHALGFSHPNETQLAIAIISALIIYLYARKMKLILYVFLIIINYIIYYYTVSRTGFIIVALLCLTSYFGRMSKARYVITKGLVFVFPVSILVTVVTGLLYGKYAWTVSLDRLLTGRIAYNHTIFTSSFPPLIGSTQYNSLVNIDNGIVNLIYEGGILAFVWFVFNQMRTIFILSKKLDFDRLLFIGFFAVFSLTESFYPSAAVNTSLIFFGVAMFQQNNHEYEAIRTLAIPRIRKGSDHH